MNPYLPVIAWQSRAILGPSLARAFAQLVHRDLAACVRAAHHAARVRCRPGPADRHTHVGRSARRLPALSRAGHSRLHRIHVVVFPIAVRRLHSNALSEIVGRATHDSGAAGTRGLGRSTLGGDARHGLRGHGLFRARGVWPRGPNLRCIGCGCRSSCRFCSSPRSPFRPWASASRRSSPASIT